MGLQQESGMYSKAVPFGVLFDSDPLCDHHVVLFWLL